MNEIKSLADQLRQSMATKPADKNGGQKSSARKATPLPPKSKPPPPILQEIHDYDTSANKAMVHVKLDPETARMLAHFKMATGIDNIKLVAFSVRHLFATQPELKNLHQKLTSKTSF